MEQSQELELSIVVPVYNEQDCVEKLYGEIVDATAGIDGCEVIFIDDGSTDNTASVLELKVPDFATELSSTPST